MLKRAISIESLHCKWSLKSSTTEIQKRKCLRTLCSCNSNNRPNLEIVKHSTGKHGGPISQVTTNKSKKSTCQPILEHFDRQYSNELGTLWASARSVLMDPNSWQYGVMLNRFTTLTDVKGILQSQGFSSLLPQTDASTLSYSDPISIQPSNQRAENGLLSLPNSIIKDLPKSHNPRLPPDKTSHLLNRLNLDPHSEPLSPSSLPLPLLQCYIHPSAVHFPSQPHRPGQLKQYYLLNAASLLPVLALQVRDGEKVLDLCSAPGGKALAIMQTANPALLCCNELDPHRRDWLAKTLESFLPQSLSNRVIISNQDGRTFGQSETGTYDKILVDTPCSNDRSWLYTSSGQQGEQRLMERDRLPALQAQLLRSALMAVRPGGVVVYSTCTLSCSENHAVIETVLDTCPWAEPDDLWEELVIPFSEHFTFSPAHPDQKQPGHKASHQLHYGTMSSFHHKHGILVVPQPGKTWGPMFICRIRRIY